MRFAGLRDYFSPGGGLWSYWKAAFTSGFARTVKLQRPTAGPAADQKTHGAAHGAAMIAPITPTNIQKNEVPAIVGL